MLHVPAMPGSLGKGVSILTQDEREQAADALSTEAADWIINKLDGTLDASFRKRVVLKHNIKAWLLSYAIFQGETVLKVALRQRGMRRKREEQKAGGA